MTPRFDTFIFDLDGTLLDTLPDLVVNTNTALAQMGYPVRPEKDILASIGAGLPVLIRRLLPQECTDEEVHAVMDCWKRIYPQCGRKLTAEYPGTSELLRTLQMRGIRLAVLSNKFDKGTQELIADFFPGIFQIVHGEGPSIPRKPDPTGLLKTMTELGATAPQTVYIGDSPSDIEVARRAHVFSLGAAWGCYGAEVLEKAEADVVVQKPLDMLEYACG